MRVLHFYKTYLSETVGGIEQVIFQLCESSGPWGIDNHVLTLSSDPHPPVVPFGGHVVHRARLDLQLASTGFSLSVFSSSASWRRRRTWSTTTSPGRSWTWCISSPV